MNEPVHIFTVNATLQLKTLSSPAIAVFLSKITFRDNVQAQIQLDFPSWTRCRQQGIFHLDGTTAIPGFDISEGVKINLRLRSGIAQTLPQDPTEMIRAILTLDGPCMHTEAWLATEVTQTLPVPGEDGLTTDIGIQTQWAHEWLP